VFEDVTIREGGTEATPESRTSATNGVGARSGADVAGVPGVPLRGGIAATVERDRWTR
jgi:hypothetical protein